MAFEHNIPYITTKIWNATHNTVGTGFFIQHKFSNQDKMNVFEFVVSNKHVFSDRLSNIVFDVTLKKENGLPDHGNTYQFNGSLVQRMYFEHPNPDVDLACIMFNSKKINTNELYYLPIFDEFLENISHSKIASGSQIIFVGYPQGIYDRKNNLPIIRSGIIASALHIDYDGKGQFLIDAQVFRGSSGSPVFVTQNNQWYLIGVLYGCIFGNNPVNVVNIAECNNTKLTYSESLGLGVVIKQKYIAELIQFATVEILKQLKHELIKHGIDKNEMEKYIDNYKYPIEENNLLPNPIERPKPKYDHIS